MRRLILTMALALVLATSGGAAGVERLRFELELVRAPAVVVAEAMLLSTGEGTDDAAWRGHLPAATTKGLMRCAVAGEPEKELRDQKLETTREPHLFNYAELWQEQASARKEGRPTPVFDEPFEETHEQGYSLSAILKPCQAGTLTTVQFRWMGTPAIRPVNSWPVKGRAARLIQDRKWEFLTRRTLTARPQLLAVAPEPPQADGKPTGFVLLAFAKVTGRAAPAGDELKAIPRTLQCWTFEIPSAATPEWLSRRTGSGDDEAQFKKLFGDLRRGTGAALTGLQMLREELNEVPNEKHFVDSRLTWQEPRGFEPPDTRYVKFVPVCNDHYTTYVAQRLENSRDDAFLTLPVGALTWTRWHGATRGALDEPVGVENSAEGSGTCGLFTGCEPGRVVLSNAHTCGPATRLTFLRVLTPQRSRPHAEESTLTVIESPPGRWLPRLAEGADLTVMLPELKAAVAAEKAAVIHAEICTCSAASIFWKREDTWPCMSFGDFLNPSIHDGKLCFNPRFVAGSTAACDMQIEYRGGLGTSLRGPPVSRRFGYWLPGADGYSAETSKVSLTEWPELTSNSSAAISPGHEVVRSVSLGRSWMSPENQALHWFVVRRAELAGTEPAEPVESSPPVPVASFTITDAAGAVMQHVALPAGKYNLVADGRQVQSLQPWNVVPEHQFKESADTPGAGKRMHDQPHIEQILDGIRVEIREGKWTIDYSREPARKVTENLTAMTEQPIANGDYKTEEIPVACERLILRRETLTGKLPVPGGSEPHSLDGGRILTLRVR